MFGSTRAAVARALHTARVARLRRRGRPRMAVRATYEYRAPGLAYATRCL